MHIFQEEFQKHSQITDKLLRKASSYKEKGEYGSALEYYLQSMQEYATAMNAFENWERASQLLDAHSKIHYVEAAELELNVLTTLEGISRNIVVCYLAKNDIQKASYFLSFLDDIVKALDRFASKLNIEKQNYYSNLIKHVELLKAEKSARSADELKLVLGFSNSGLQSDGGNLETCISYYNEQFDKAVKAIDKVKSLWVSGLRKDDSNFSTPETSSACFIATAAYATENHPDIDTFRTFRDKVLLANSLGKLFVRVYYQVGPYLANYVKKNLIIQQLIRRCLRYLATWMRMIF